MSESEKNNGTGTARRDPDIASAEVETRAASSPPTSVKPPAEGAAPSASPSVPAPDPLVAAQAEAGKLREQLLRTAADYDNFRKRTRRDLDDAHRKGAEELLRALLPVFDN